MSNGLAESSLRSHPIDKTVDGALLHVAFQPVAAASSVVFRIAFGCIASYWAIDYLVTGRVKFLYVDPQFHFTYYGFDWAQPWPGGMVYLHFGLMAILGMCIAAGISYRWTSTAFAALFTYFFLMDRTNYQNHYYLISLISWWLPFLPLAESFSVDSLTSPGHSSDDSTPVADRPTAIASAIMPAWVLFVLRFHIAVPYFFGGIAKLNADWFAGSPMRQMLAARIATPIVGTWLIEEPVVQLFSWGGLLLDLFIVPALVWRRTRVAAFLIACMFHVMNAFLFSIHIFPWFMIVATTIFFEPDWPIKLAMRVRSLLGGNATASDVANQSDRAPSVTTPVPKSAARFSAVGVHPRQRLLIGFIGVYCAFHCLWPLRLHLEPGDCAWHERGHYFSWRMMLRLKITGARFYMTDAKTGETWIPDIRQYISEVQYTRFARDPEMVLHLAHFLADRHQQKTGQRPEVRAWVLASLNGRRPQRLIDPEVDLAAIPRGYFRRDWILPLTEPLLHDAWNIPMNQWEQNLDLPPMKFLQNATSHQTPGPGAAALQTPTLQPATSESKPSSVTQNPAAAAATYSPVSTQVAPASLLPRRS